MINISKAAQAEVRRLQSRCKNPQMKLRLGVKTGGCAELYYTVNFDLESNPEDYIQDCDGIVIVVNDFSFRYIADLTLDYSEDLMGGGFRFHNRQATVTCSCGNSFSLLFEQTT